MTQESPHRPAVRQSILHFLYDYHRVNEGLLVAAVHAETNAAAWMIRTTLKRMDAHDVIYNAGSEGAPEWKVAEP